jgi:hypothetical protein
MSDFADIMSFLTLTSAMKLSSPPPMQNTAKVFEAHAKAKEAAEAWLARMAVDSDEYGYQEDPEDTAEDAEDSGQ